MDEQNIFEVVEAVSGTPIILTLKGFDWFDTYSIWVPRPEPICYWCGEVMTFLKTKPKGLFPEVWRCKDCGRSEEFFPGDYGEYEVEISAEEWEHRAMVRSQRELLERRYGKQMPKSIRDYWQR